jgi:hypothetical protein
VFLLGLHRQRWRSEASGFDQHFHQAEFPLLARVNGPTVHGFQKYIRVIDVQIA